MSLQHKMSVCQSVLRKDTEPQIAPEVCAMIVCVNECMNVCVNGVNGM